MVSGLLLVLAWQSPRPVVIDIEGTDLVSRIDLHDPEPGPHGMFRWTESRSTITFPGIGLGTWRLSLGLASGRDPDSPAPQVDVMVSPGAVPLDRLTPTGRETQTFDLLTPLSTEPAGDLTVVLVTNPLYTPPGEPRTLGVQFDFAVLTPLGPVIPPLGVLAALLGVVVLVGLGLAALGGWQLVWGGGLAVTVGLSAALAWNRLWVTPFAFTMLLLAALLAAGVWLIRWSLASFAFAPPGSQKGLLWKRIRFVLLLGLLGVGLVGGAQGLDFAFKRERAVDFRAHWEASRRFNEGAPLYDLAALRANIFSDLYKYPPLLAGLLRPFALLDYPTARDYWRLILLLSLVVAVGVISWSFVRQPFPPLAADDGSTEARTAWERLMQPTLLFVTVVALFRPMVDALNYGQLDPAILLLLALTLVGLRADRPALAGWALALATALKLYPGILILYLVWRREWRAVGNFAVAVVAWNVLAAALTNLNDTLTYYTQVLQLSGGSSAWVENQTISGFVARLFTDHLRQEEFPQTLLLRWLLLNGLTYATLIVTVGISLWAARRVRPGDGMAYALGFCMLVCVSVFALPVAWLHYLVAFLLPLAVALYALACAGREWWATAPRLTLWAVVLLVLGTILLAYENIWIVYEKVNLGALWKLVLSYKLYGEMAIWVSLLIMLHLVRRTSSATSTEEYYAPSYPKSRLAEKKGNRLPTDRD